MWSDISDLGIESSDELSKDHILRDLQIRNTLSLLEWLYDSNKVNDNEYTTLQDMIKSSDKGNFSIAMEIIKIKKG